MSFRCIVKNCPGQNSKDIKLFRFPPEDKDAWCMNVKMPVTELKGCFRVCSRHFETSWIGNKKLKIGARPTLLLGHNDFVPSDNGRKEKYHVRKCSVAGCNETSPPTTLFSFPNDKKLFEEWIERCPIRETLAADTKKYICKYHFHPSIVLKNRLPKHAYPIPADDRFVNAQIKCISLQELLVENGKKSALEVYEPETANQIKTILQEGLRCPLPTVASFPNTTIWCVTPQLKHAANTMNSGPEFVKNKKMKFHPDMVPKNGLRTNNIILPVHDGSEKTASASIEEISSDTETTTSPNIHKIRRRLLKSCRQCHILKRLRKFNTKRLNNENLKLKREIASLRSELYLWKRRWENMTLTFSMGVKDESNEKVEEISNINLNTNFCKNLQADSAVEADSIPKGEKINKNLTDLCENIESDTVIIKTENIETDTVLVKNEDDFGCEFIKL